MYYGGIDHPLKRKPISEENKKPKQTDDGVFKPSQKNIDTLRYRSHDLQCNKYQCWFNNRSNKTTISINKEQFQDAKNAYDRITRMKNIYYLGRTKFIDNNGSNKPYTLKCDNNACQFDDEFGHMLHQINSDDVDFETIKAKHQPSLNTQTRQLLSDLTKDLE